MQLFRDRKTFMTLLIMPFMITLLFGFSMGGFGRAVSDSRLPVGILDEDGSSMSGHLRDLLKGSDVIRLVSYANSSRDQLEALVADDQLAAAFVVPQGYGRTLLNGKRPKIVMIGDDSSTSGTIIKSEAIASATRLESAVRTALVFEQLVGDKIAFNYILEQALLKWQQPPIGVEEIPSSVIQEEDKTAQSLANLSPGIMLQFAIASLLNSAQILVFERQSRALKRLLTTATRRIHILVGHYITIFIMLMTQFLILLTFGQIVFKVNYLRDPLASGIVAIMAAACIAALGLLIGTLARNEDQAVIFSLIPMFVFSGLGGAWVPLEVTGPVFQAVGHVSPIAWALDGFKNIVIRGLGFNSVILPVAALAAYGIIFFTLSVVRFRME
jgi:ABC-2 type transport system permease protein